MLDDLRTMDFLEQVAALDQAASDADPASLPALRDVFLNPLGDAASDKMVRSALRAVLLASPALALEGLNHEDDDYRRLCINVLADARDPAAGKKLAELAMDEPDPDTATDLLRALAAMDDPAYLPVFRDRVEDLDPIIAGLAIETLGRARDVETLPDLMIIVTANEAEATYETCEVTTYKAIEAIASIGTDEALAFLAEKLHHANPTARRLIHEALTRTGAPAVPHVVAALENATPADHDQRIMAANVLGFIGDKAGANALVHGLDEGMGVNPNVRFAIYEALGRIPCIKSLVALLDGVAADEDESVLTAIFTSLEQQAKPAVAERIIEAFRTTHAEAPDRADMLSRSLAAAGAAALCAMLASADDGEALAGPVADKVAAMGDPVAIDAFARALEQSGAAAAGAIASRLQAGAKTAARGRMLAIDDSDAMRNFYRSAGAEMGFNVVTAEDGRAGLMALEAAESEGIPFHVIVVDMNMPVMDGIEFTTKARAMEICCETPIAMATTESAKKQAVLAKKAGVSTFVNKPFTLAVFQNKIDKLLQS